jgi:hypothetical protein
VDGLRAAKTAAHFDLAGAELDDELFDQEIEDGLSANLCEALIKLAGEKSRLDGRLALRVRWALTRPTGERATTVEIERGEISRLHEIAEILKRIEPIPDATVRGPVVRLAREPGEEHGRIEIHADIDGRTKLVRILVDLSDYQLAWTAHVGDREIAATGVLERAGKVRELTNVTRLDVV